LILVDNCEDFAIAATPSCELAEARWAGRPINPASQCRKAVVGNITPLTSRCQVCTRHHYVEYEFLLYSGEVY